MLQAVSIGIQKQSPWVLIVDNADNLGLFGIGDVASSKTMRSYIPAGPGGTVLWTTRDEQILGTLVGTRRGIKIARMTDGEAKRLLSLARGDDPVGSDDEQAIEALLEELQWLPLAIFQAGAYMRETLTELTEYLELLRQGQKRWEVLKESYNDPQRREGVSNSVLATWSISIQYLKQHNKLAYEILHIIAYLDNQKIQQEVLQEAGLVVASQATADQEHQHDELAIGRAIKRLRDFSFLTRRTEAESELSYEMHKLVQEGIRYQLSCAGQTEQSISMGTALNDGQSCHEEYGCAHLALKVVDNLFPDYQEGEVGLWGQCERYLAHCIQMAGFANRHGGGTVGGHLLKRAGLYAGDRGMFRQAEILEGAALTLLREKLGEDDPDVLQVSANLAVTYRQLRRDYEAEKLLLEVLQRGKEALGGEHAVVLNTMYHLTGLQRLFGRHSEAERLITEVHRIRHEKLGEMHIDTISSAGMVASIYINQGHYTKAKEIQVRVLERYRRILGEMHPDTIASEANLASTYHHMGDYVKAREIAIRVLKQRRQLLGEVHPDTIASEANLASTYHRMGDYTKAKEIKMRVLEQRRQLLGEVHPDTIASAANLAATYYEQGNYIEDEKISIQVLEYRRQLFGEMHPATMASVASLAATYCQQGNYTKAKEMNIQVLEYRRQIFGEMHPETIASATDLATVYHRLGEFNAAEVIYTSVLEQSLRLFGEMHPETLHIKHGIADLWFSLSRLEEAARLMEECVLRRREVLGPTHPDTENSEQRLAQMKEAHASPT